MFFGPLVIEMKAPNAFIVHDGGGEEEEKNQLTWISSPC